ncbi:N-acylethanolamine-hydrolyzing acid amidase-like [Brienomyrus brachyistius]|uniref:N-acylethanolamine-hydrolyzing acid amidase-like n=1 Tax=Brienomyrus brachyistius TaxID=42636 RepID=UPI0020B29B93|nr:N-acylethanolamine-hydrolyzing acid amidase-like [Brienomyrus brachyistius]
MKCCLALIHLTLAACCYADFAPPIVKVSLDEPPKERWAPLMEVIDVSYFRTLPSLIIESFVPSWLHQAIRLVIETLEDYLPQDYLSEIQGLASLSGTDSTDIILLNFGYEISAYCTSIVAQDTNGRIYHGRNMDFPLFRDILRNVTVDILFMKDAKVAYRGTSYAGYVGLWTGQSANNFTITGNARLAGSWWGSVIWAFICKFTPASWLLRHTLAEAASYHDALERLSNVPIINSVYYIVGGVQPGEGAVVTRDPWGSADVWSLDPPHGHWFRVESNKDHWKTTPEDDERRKSAIKALNATGQENINLDSLFKVLSVNVTCRRSTIYTTVMSAGTPEKYRTVVREHGCN